MGDARLQDVRVGWHAHLDARHREQVHICGEGQEEPVGGATQRARGVLDEPPDGDRVPGLVVIVRRVLIRVGIVVNPLVVVARLVGASMAHAEQRHEAKGEGVYDNARP